MHQITGFGLRNEDHSFVKKVEEELPKVTMAHGQINSTPFEELDDFHKAERVILKDGAIPKVLDINAIKIAQD